MPRPYPVGGSFRLPFLEAKFRGAAPLDGNRLTNGKKDLTPVGVGLVRAGVQHMVG